MDTEEIDYILTKLAGCSFGGVFPSDQIPNVEIDNHMKCFVINTDDSSQSGSHWVAVIFEPHQSIYFDSYGLKPFVPSIKQFVGDNYKYNAKQLQHPLSTTCGEWCIFFILTYITGHSLKCIHQLFENNSDLLFNDYAVNKFVNKISGKRKRFIDLKFLKKQLAKSMRENMLKI